MSAARDPIDRFTAVFGVAYALMIGAVARDAWVGVGVAASNAVLGWSLLRVAPRLRGACNGGLAYAGTVLPLLVFFVFYRESMLALASPVIAFHDAALVTIERGASTFVPTFPHPWLGECLALAYMAYLPLLFLASIALFESGGRGATAPAARTLRCIGYAWAVCFVLYLAFPVLGPRFLDPALQAARLGTGPFSRLAVANEGLMLRGGAFPSAHVAATAVSLLALWRWRRRLFWALLPVGVSLAAGAVYLGYHYVIDVLAGFVVGVGAFALDVRRGAIAGVAHARAVDP